jgi:uncharacterized membrane protein
VADPERLRRDQRVERVIGALLRAGVLISIAVALAGMAMYLGHGGKRVADFRVFRGEPFDLRGAAAIVRAAFAADREAIIQLGVLILIATPIARVVLSLLAFARERDATYVAVTGIVLVVLLAGLLGIGP